MLAAKISFMNEVADMCECLGVDAENVRKGIGSDSRIGYSFIYPGCGYGGSCFPKDVKALIRTARQVGIEPALLASVEKRNEMQKQLMPQKIRNRFGDNLTGLMFCVWGLSFKPGTDDMREASSIVIISELIRSGAVIKAYDPVAMEQAKKALPEHFFTENRLLLADDQYAPLEHAHALILVTEWKTFRQPDFEQMGRRMKEKIIFDGRNQYDPQEAREYGFEYHGIGREL
jgi:UDPglucose 6-dehydrogenase